MKGNPDAKTVRTMYNWDNLYIYAQVFIGIQDDPNIQFNILNNSFAR